MEIKNNQKRKRNKKKRNLTNTKKKKQTENVSKYLENVTNSRRIRSQSH